jgi:pilus assembly protein Flp/PilA
LSAGGKQPTASERGEVSELPLGPQEEGQGLVEYALVLVLIAIVVIAIVLLVWPALTEILNDAGITIPDQLKSLF